MKQSIRLLLAFLLGFYILAETVSAAGLNYYGIESEVGNNVIVYTTVTLIFDSAVNHFDFNVDFNVMNLTAETSSGTGRCFAENSGTRGVIRCDLYAEGEGENTVKLTFSSKNAVENLGDNYEFSAGFPVILPTSRMFSIVKLPPKGLLAGEVVNQSYFPPDGKVLTDGKHIIISWEKKNLTQGDILTFSANFEVAAAGGLLWDVSVIALTSVVVIIMVGIAVYMRRGPATVRQEVKVLPLLNKDEKKIVDIIARSEGEARQRNLVKESDFSKAKVSRLVKNLKERGVVDIEPISGRENKVILKIKGVE